MSLNLTKIKQHLASRLQLQTDASDSIVAISDSTTVSVKTTPFVHIIIKHEGDTLEVKYGHGFDEDMGDDTWF
jgi:hypothetical protein